MKINLDTYGDLYVHRVRGMLARMLTIYCIREQCDAPAPLLAVLNGSDENLTTRSIAEFAFDCGFYIDFTLRETPMDEDQTGEA